MKTSTAAALVGSAIYTVSAAPADLNIGPIKEKGARDVDTYYPYTGPEIPVGDWVDPSVNGVEGLGFPRLIEPPAVAPSSKK